MSRRAEQTGQMDIPGAGSAWMWEQAAPAAFWWCLSRAVTMPGTSCSDISPVRLGVRSVPKLTLILISISLHVQTHSHSRI